MSEDWEILACEIAKVLADGNISLEDVSDQVASISDSFPCSRVIDQVGKIIRSVSEKDSIIDELQEYLDDAQNGDDPATLPKGQIISVASEVAEALGTLKFPYVYPDPESRQLRAVLAEDSGLESDYILAGCGADELIDLIMRCVRDPGDKFVDCPPTFTMYEFDAAMNGALVIKVSRLLDFSLVVSRIVEVVKQEKPKCIFLTSPNNPDGSVISDKDLLKILSLHVLVVLDEAYIEFSGMKSRMDWVKPSISEAYTNLMILILKALPRFEIAS